MRFLSCITVVCAFFAFSGCRDATAPSQLMLSSGLDNVPALPVVDPSSLHVSDVNIVQYANPQTGGSLQPLVDFRYSGLAEFAEVSVCPETEQGCSNPVNIFNTKSLIPNSASGARVVVRVRACIDPLRSPRAENCGPWTEGSYRQWVVNSEVAAATRELHAIAASAQELAELVRQTIDLSAERAKKCSPSTPEQRKAFEADAGLASAIGRLGRGAVGLIANHLVSGVGSCGASQLTNADSTLPFIGPNGLSSDQIRAVMDKISSSLQTKAQLQGKPELSRCLARTSAPAGSRLTLNHVAAAIPAISSAIFDLATAGRRVALEGTCIGSLGSKHDAAVQAAVNSMIELAEELKIRHSQTMLRIRGDKP